MIDLESRLCGDIFSRDNSLFNILGLWPKLNEYLPLDRQIEIDPKDALRIAFSEMSLAGRCAWPAKFSNHPPELNYMKKSSVEENEKRKL
jgi:hypothetical protein